MLQSSSRGRAGARACGARPRPPSPAACCRAARPRRRASRATASWSRVSTSIWIGSDGPPARRAAASGVGHATGDRDVVVLDQNRVVQAHPVVAAAACVDGVLLEQPQPGRRLARVGHRDVRAGDGVHVARVRSWRCPTAAAPGSAPRVRAVRIPAAAPSSSRRVVPAATPAPSSTQIAHANAFVHDPEDRLGNAQARDDAALARNHGGTGACRRRHDARGGDVARGRRPRPGTGAPRARWWRHRWRRGDAGRTDLSPCAPATFRSARACARAARAPALARSSGSVTTGVTVAHAEVDLLEGVQPHVRALVARAAVVGRRRE